MNGGNNDSGSGLNGAEQVLVSVVIPCYDQGAYLHEAIASVLSSTLTRFEIVVVNDGSTDKHTLEILSKRSWPKTRVIHQENKGLAGARNTGIAHSRGKFILPLDSDDRIAPSFLETAVRLLSDREDIAFVYCYAQLFGDESGIWITGDFSPRKLVIKNYIPASAVFLKSIWEEAGGYDESDILRAGFEDWDFWLRVAGKGHKGHCIHEPLFYYRKHAGSMLAGSRLQNKELTDYILNKNKDIIVLLKNSDGKKLLDTTGIVRVLVNIYRFIRPAIPASWRDRAKKVFGFIMKD